MRKKTYFFVLIMVVVLGACNKEPEGEITPTPTEILETTVMPSFTSTPAITFTPIPTPTPTEDQKFATYISTIETINWSQLNGEVDEETSRKNSNLLNFGYLDYDEEGNIYYINKGDRGIYSCGARGENLRLIGQLQMADRMLQKKGEWLYFYNNKTRNLDRVHIETGELEHILEDGTYGQFVIIGDKILTRGEGFCSYDLTGNNEEVLENTVGANLCYYSRGDGFWICETYRLVDKYYLLQYDGKTVRRLKQKGSFPLMAGHYLSVVDPETKERHIWNLDTKKDTNLSVMTEKTVVSNGKVFYFSGPSVMRSMEEYYTPIYCWDGVSKKKLLTVEGARNIYHLFLTPDMLYYMPQVKVGNNMCHQLWYYDLQTGETGQIY